jgi:thiol:disulfide interchange protein DsbC
MLRSTLAVALATGLSLSVQAGEKENIERIEAVVARLAPGASADSVAPSPIPGVYEVVLGPNLLYISADGRYLLQGDLFDLDTRTNLSAEKRDKARLAAVDAVGEENMFIFAPKDKPAEHTITVFTDIDCGYCRKLHREIGKYNDAGIRVRYLMYPRAGVNSPSYQKAVSAWCADDRNAALTRAKMGKEIEKRECDNPVREHMALGEVVGVSGTPTMILEDGQLVPGYVPAARLSQLLAAHQ